MVIKVKELTIGRSRKWAWDYGNTVGFTISVTVEGTTVKDNPEDMKRMAMNELLVLQDNEYERCRNEYDIADLNAQLEFDDKVEKSEVLSGQGLTDILPTSDFPSDSKALPVVAEVDPTSDEIQYDSKTFKKFQPCKYKCGMFTAWGQPYTQGDRKLHMNPLTKEILGYECPAFDEGGS